MFFSSHSIHSLIITEVTSVRSFTFCYTESGVSTSMTKKQYPFLLCILDRKGKYDKGQKAGPVPIVFRWQRSIPTLASAWSITSAVRWVLTPNCCDINIFAINIFADLPTVHLSDSLPVAQYWPRQPLVSKYIIGQSQPLTNIYFGCILLIRVKFNQGGIYVCPCPY